MAGHLARDDGLVHREVVEPERRGAGKKRVMLSYRVLRLLERVGVTTRFSADLDAVRQSTLFDEAWYAQQLSGRVPPDLAVHYLIRGAGDGLDPHPLFDTDFYQSMVVEAAGPGTNALAHYHATGDAEGRRPSPWFDAGWYRQFYKVSPPSGTTVLAEYWQTGQFAARSPHPLFDVAWYSARYAGQMSHRNPVVDMIHGGLAQGRVPHRAFDGASRIGADPAGVMKAVTEAMATSDPLGPRRVSTKSFSDETEEAFLTELAGRVAEADALANPPLVSIITPTRDRAGILPKAIRSVLAQGYRNWELIVIDDGSMDDTAEVMAGFDDPRVRYLKGRGAGAADARNIGLAAAQGDLIAYLDSDNVWVPQYLETMVGFLLVEDLDLAYSGMRLESEEGVRFRGRGFNYPELVQLNYIDLNSILHRRSLLEKHGGFDTRLRRMMDWDLLLRYTKDARVKYAKFIGVIYDEHREGDRITVRESIAWRFDVMNRYLIDWAALEAGMADRDPDLVSIVIPVYGKFEVTNACLESLYRHPAGRRFEIILVNNRSDHATLANLMLWEKTRDNVRVVPCWSNLNFALGCNVGFSHTRGRLVVFLNNDTLVSDNWIAPLAEELDDPTVAAVQPKLLYPDLTVQSYGAAFSEAGVISHMLYRNEPGDAPHVNKRRVLQAIHGACLGVRAEDFARVQGFDPQFVNGQEDVDFCLRLNAATGGSMVVQPRSTILHLEGKTRTGRNPHNRRNRTIFVERWRDKVRPDDRAIYEADGFSVAGYEPDSDEFVRLGVAVFEPSLRRPGD